MCIVCIRNIALSNQAQCAVCVYVCVCVCACVCAPLSYEYNFSRIVSLLLESTQ